MLRTIWGPMSVSGRVPGTTGTREALRTVAAVTQRQTKPSITRNRDIRQPLPEGQPIGSCTLQTVLGQRSNRRERNEEGT